MIKQLISLVVASFILASCTKNAVTGRSQLKLLPEAEVQSMALQEYQTFLSQNKVVGATTNKDAEMVRRVGQRISAVVEKYYADKGLSSSLEGYKWEYNLVDSKEVNAWCMPGGKIVVYTGLLPVTQNEAALAVVMGHEVSHAIFQHGNSRMSEGLVQQLGGVALSVALANKPAATQELFQTAYGVGSQVGVMLPFSRKDETEADEWGIIWAAMAGYNPQEAIPLWQRMASAGGQKPPEFLSTHPSDERRIADLQAHMPEALKYYKPIAK
ncbi:MAG: M48 family metallopeptidase [Bacteroidetes bacterium]|nr:M48 family metallopeptidase [Bacteroidota bacterium]MBS1608375.1 M48 family metallopeptidase [Bacteroidota bacterium]